MKRFICIVSLFFVCSGFAQYNSDLPLIPMPNRVERLAGTFNLNAQTTIYCSSDKLKGYLNYFNAVLQNQIGRSAAQSSDSLSANCIVLNLRTPTAALLESYDLRITPKNIYISGDTAGIFYALQTLRQLIGSTKSATHVLPCLHIEDRSRFSWRGMHLDVSRHFFPVSFVKRYIDLLALHKMNVFHWHLTDDQGWRIEIKKYPKLTKVGAYRKGSMLGKYSDAKYDSVNYGGYYAQEEIKEVVRYAQERRVNIVPEIEMPGHAQAAIAAYPYLSCRGANMDVAKGWGVFEDVFCSKDSTYIFLKDVLDEVMNLFPGQYIHIGGDECPKTRWKACAVCQSLMKREGLKDEHELQSYFIKRIEKHVNARGKKIIGWDEILEGGLAPNAAVMSWRGEEGGIAAAKAQHRVVMTPGSHCYFDHYQAAPAEEPWAIGGYTPLEKVYAYEPVPKALNASEAQMVMGAQGNVWTEYILDSSHVEYMSVPRMAALAEVLWTNAENKNESSFLARLQKHFLLLDHMHVNYAKALYQVNYDLTQDQNSRLPLLRLSANASLGQIHYTLDGSQPSAKSPLYQNPLALKGQLMVNAALFDHGTIRGRILHRAFDVNLATGKKITFDKEPSKYYNAGSFVMVNGESATLPRINNQWNGWSGDDMSITLDLEKATDIHAVQIGFLDEEMNWIYLPYTVQLWLSVDGQNYSEVKTITREQLQNKRQAEFSFAAIKARYVKVLAKNKGKIASGMPGAGEDAWLFCDEINIK